MMFFTTSMEPQLLIGWQQETVDVCRLQEELAEGRAEKHELEARCSALRERVRSVWYGYCAPHIQSNLTCLFIQLSKNVSPALLQQVEEDQRLFRKQIREGREREARQALLIKRLQNKVIMW